MPGEVCVVTGASAGFGEAIAGKLAQRGHRLALGARRADLLAKVAETCRGLGSPQVFHHPLDVTDLPSVRAFVAATLGAFGRIDVLVNNAGLARGVEKVAEAEGRAWREMIETNVVGVLQVTREVLPGMIERGGGHVVMIGSIAGHKAYAGGSVYCATKRALQSLCESLRIELLGKNIRVTNVEPGLAETEFSVVRFSGDAARAQKVYQDIKPLRAEDIGECVVWAVERPRHVNIETIVVMPTEQAAPGVDVRTKR